jgi:putative serine protease PepD
MFRHGVLNKASVARAEPYYEYMGNKYNAIIHLAGSSPGGTSGGSWVNEEGQVIGVQSGNMTEKGAPQGISMMAPLAAIMALMKARRHANTATLHSGLEELWEQEVGFIRAFPGDHGLIVRALKKGGALARAGVEEGYVITELDGRPLTYREDALDAIRKKAPGDSVLLQVCDSVGKHARETKVTLGALEALWRAPKKP